MPVFNWGLLARVLIVWLAIAIAETVQDVLRRLWLSEAWRQATEVFWIALGSLLAFAIAFWSARWMNLRTTRQAVGAGLLWAALMVAYELIVVQLAGYPATAFLKELDPRQGGLMGLALGILALTPWMVSRLRSS